MTGIRPIPLGLRRPHREVQDCRVLICVTLSLAFAGAFIVQRVLAAPASSEAGLTEQALKSFAVLDPIDVHVHVFKTDPAFQAVLERLHLKLVNILVMDDTLSYRKQLQPQIGDALALVRASRGHVALCTTFDPYKFNDRVFPNDAVEQLDGDFAGAVAVKIWKNMGMEIKDPNGKFIMPDDLKFLHLQRDCDTRRDADVTRCRARRCMGASRSLRSFVVLLQENPQWFLYNKAGFPAKKTILEARDHILADNPKLRMVGVHMGSVERILDGIASRLDRYPNFAVDTAARIEYLMMAPTEKVRTFFIKYRIAFSTAPTSICSRLRTSRKR